AAREAEGARPEVIDQVTRRMNVAGCGDMNVASEAMGNAAGQAYMEKHAGEGWEQTPSGGTGAGVFDQVWARPDGKVRVLECKAGGSELKGRKLPDGRFAMQGTPEYVREICRLGEEELANAQKIADPTARAHAVAEAEPRARAAQQVREALESGNLEYQQV